MKDFNVVQLGIPEVKVLQFGKIKDHRGFLMETLRQSDFADPALPFGVSGFPLAQINESVSVAGTVRGLHFQCRPYIGKLVRPIKGDIIDLALDIRLGSRTFGHIVGHRLTPGFAHDFEEWMWVPPGFGHGVLALEETHLMYLLTGEYNPDGEVAITITSPDIDWSLCERTVADVSRSSIESESVMTERDRGGILLSDWRLATHELARDFTAERVPSA